MIAESIYVQIDDQNFTTSFLDEIMDHEKTKEVIDIIDIFTGINNKAVVTTKGRIIKVK